MTNPPGILAASYLGASGHGNDRTGLRPWPEPLAPALAQGRLAELHWSLLFSSDPARFARMDLMSRLGLMAVERLDATLDAWPASRRDRLGVCVETSTGSLNTDVRFLHTPRASLFTYTLPSTVIGEICIRYRLRGPVLCLITPPGAPSAALLEARDWLAQDQADACLCVSVEALDPDTTPFLPTEVAPSAWHACALLLANVRAEASPSSARPLADLCQSLCTALPDASD